ncbi:MFS transporter [Rhabdaerophilum sp. SD176]|uniref:MFS transporter n=1 Tax=Rhabdaerophilum sp. SD176 TaxID=2983548 RepID=UPI0024DF3D0C|nr:MFS transporter [Rhabdaerophilum sp. SD176]
MNATASRALAPGLIILAGCACSMLTFGPRATMGFFQQPIISTHGWGRDVFAMALAIQNLLWGVGQPFMGAIADRFGTLRVLWVGASLYAAGLALMTVAGDPLTLNLTAGVLIGFGLAGSSFNLVLAAFGKLLPPEKRSMAFGAGTAAGSFGQFLFSPLGVALIRDYGWQNALLIFAGLTMLVLPLALAIATPPQKQAAANAAPSADNQSVKQALNQAFRHRSYVLLVLGFFTCGFQLAFITVHLPSYFKDIGLPPEVGGWTLALVGIFNIVGSLSAGWLGNRMPKRWILAAIYFARSVVTIGLLLSIPFVAQPVSVFGIVTTVGVLSALTFGAFTGLLWLSTVPPTAALVSIMFGPRYMAMLYGFAFFSHQVGAFLGVWLGGLLFERTGSYDVVWWLSVGLGVASAIINLPIIERAAPGRWQPQPA